MDNSHRAERRARERRSTASWGLRPRRLAAFGRPGSLTRSSHPASPGYECVGYADECLLRTCPPPSPLLPHAHPLTQPSNWLSRKAMWRRQRFIREGTSRGDGGAGGRFRSRWARFWTSGRAGEGFRCPHVPGLPGCRSAEPRSPRRSRPASSSANGEPIPQNSPLARQAAPEPAVARR